MKVPRVLVLDGDMVPSLTVSRSLSRRGCLVELGSHSVNPLGQYSRSVSAVLRYPDPLSATAEFLEWIVQQTQQSPYDLVIPVTERTLVPLSQARDRMQHVKIAMPPAASLEVALDKAKTLALAEELDVRGPQGVLLESLEQLAAHKDQLSYPVVLKPARSIGAGENGASQLQVSYAFDEQQLQAGCTHALRFGPVLLQVYFPGDGVGVELIARNGEIAYAFQHRRLHEVPLTGGGSSLRKSEAVTPALLEASAKLVAAMQWNGVAMVEFKLNSSTGEFCLMEINGRFWGSLPLAHAAGADFPSMLLDLELEGDIQPCVPYRNDIYCRLLSRDLHWYEAVFRSQADPRITRVPTRLAIIRELGLFLSPKHYFDVQSWRDPLPGLIDVGRLLRNYTLRFGTLITEKVFLWRQQWAWRRGAVAEVIAQANSVLFLCYGNINRSALAAAMVRAYAEDSGITVNSAGFHEETGRPADPVMVEVAGSFDVDMRSNRSQCVTPAMLSASDVIFVMEKAHYDRLLAIDDSLADRIFLLGAHPVNKAWPPEIDDPYGLSRAHYEVCYERIASAVDDIKAMMAVRSVD